jgi:hypothetical protein
MEDTQPKRLLYHIMLTYKTPTNRDGSGTYHKRGDTEEEAILEAKNQLINDPRTRVAGGMEGITVKVYGVDD